MKILDILQDIPYTIKGNSKYYNGLKIKEKFDKIGEYFEDETVLMVPFYLPLKKTYELYEFELKINEVSEKNFDKHILKLMGKSDLSEVPDYIIDREKYTYIEFLKNSSENLILPVRRYLHYIFSDARVKKEIVEVFGSYDQFNIFFAIY